LKIATEIAPAFLVKSLIPVGEVSKIPALHLRPFGAWVFSERIIMKTYVAKPQTVERDWCLVDATDKILGRLATELASRLRGKHKPEFTPHVDTGDNIIVINAEKIRVTGNKLKDKVYYRHTGYIGNLKSITLEKQLDQHPERVIQSAVKGMLPRNPLGRAMFRKLHVYAGPEHPHAAQQPKALEL
jgi:large subunit ribosomal protein L13